MQGLATRPFIGLRLIEFGFEVEIFDIAQRKADGMYEVCVRFIPNSHARETGAEVATAKYEGEDEIWYCNGSQTCPGATAMLKAAQHGYFKNLPIRQI